jgi:hypothetical protein
VEQKAAGFVYFIGEGFGQPVKVGWAADPQRRLRELQIGSPRRLAVLHARPGTKKDERALHHRLKASRLSGEWFEWSAPLCDEIGGGRGQFATVDEVAAAMGARTWEVLREIREGRVPSAVVDGETVVPVDAFNAIGDPP